MKETFKRMLEDGGWYDGLCVLGGFVVMMASVLLAAVIFG